MARGGFHGGGFHSGGHHGGGGFHGGGFSGGGFHGGGFSGGHSGGGFSGGGYRGFRGGYGGFRNNDDDDFLVREGSAFLFYFAIAGIIGFVLIILLFVQMIIDHEVPGLNLINLGIFIVSWFILALSLRHYERTSDLKDLKGADLDRVGGRVWKSKGYRPTNSKGNKRTWISETGKQYCISFFDSVYGSENARKVYEVMQRTPKILWMNPFNWLTFCIIAFVVNFFFYEAVIPVFENMIMTDMAFAFIDEFVFYFMSVLSLLMSLASLIIVKVKDNLLYECAVRIVEDNKASDDREETEFFIRSQLGKKWYYNSCPNCGAEASRALRTCISCGSSLEVDKFGDYLPSGVHQISAAAGKNMKAEGEKDE